MIENIRDYVIILDCESKYCVNYNYRKGWKIMKALKITGFVLSGIQLIVSILAIYLAMSTKMLPTLYGVIGSIVLIGIAVGVFLLARLESKKLRIMAIVISSIFIIILAIGSFYLYKTNKTMDDVTGKTIETDEINVYVSKDDAVASINEAVEKGYKFGLVSMDDEKHIQETVEKIQNTVGTNIDTVSFDTVYALVGAFEAGTIQSIITSSGTLEMLDSDEKYEDFSKGLKVIMEHTITEEIVQEQKNVDKDHFCVYLSGIDTFGSVNAKSRSDVNIIGVVNNQTKQVLLLSTPRDYYVELGGAGGSMDKLTHAGLYGIESSMKTLENLYGTDLSYYVRINFSGFQNVINQLGGVDVESEMAFTSITEEGTYSFSQGVNHLNGEQALGFARARYAFTDGDRQRGRNQMQVIKATIEKLESPDALGNYANIMDSVSGMFQTDMTKDDIGYLVKSTLDNGNWNVLTYSVSGSDATQSCYSLGSSAYVMIPNKSDVEYGKELVQKVLAGETMTQDDINNYVENKGTEDVITEEQFEEDTTEEGATTEQ